MEMIHVRPRHVFSMPDDLGDEIRFFLPAPVSRGGLTILEMSILVKLMRSVKASRIFEFGTFLGETTRLLLANLPPEKGLSERVYTLDLLQTDSVSFEKPDAALAHSSVLATSRKYMLSPDAHLVKQLLQDSMTLDPAPYRSMFQFIFIDANHKLGYLKKDTENSFEMIGGPRQCIVWHDYGSPLYPELNQYLDNLARTIPIYHVGDTMLAFYLKGVSIGPG